MQKRVQQRLLARCLDQYFSFARVDISCQSNRKTLITANALGFGFYPDNSQHDTLGKVHAHYS